jgi:hypothetical protein
MAAITSRAPAVARKRRAPKGLVGGCLCDAVRYRIEGDPIDAGYCHCRLCQRSAGAPVLAWATFPIAAFTITKGKPKRYDSSRRAHRHFCARCGTQLTFRKTRGARHVDVNVATLDRPGRVPPEYHIWTASRIRWFDVRDRLPRHRDGRGDEAS